MSKLKEACLLDDITSLTVDVMVVTEFKQDNLRAFSHLLAEYKKVIPPCLPGGKGRVVLY